MQNTYLLQQTNYRPPVHGFIPGPRSVLHTIRIHTFYRPLIHGFILGPRSVLHTIRIHTSYKPLYKLHGFIIPEPWCLSHSKNTVCTLSYWKDPSPILLHFQVFWPCLMLPLWASSGSTQSSGSSQQRVKWQGSLGFSVQN